MLIFFVCSVFDHEAVLCAVKSDKQKFKDKAFINWWSASQIKHITAQRNSKLRQNILCDIDYQSFAVVESLFVWRCRRSRWRFVCNEYLASAHFRLIFVLSKGLLQIVVNVKLNKYHFFGKCNTMVLYPCQNSRFAFGVQVNQLTFFFTMRHLSFIIQHSCLRCDIEVSQ